MITTSPMAIMPGEISHQVIVLHEADTTVEAEGIRNPTKAARRVVRKIAATAKHRPHHQQ